MTVRNLKLSPSLVSSRANSGVVTSRQRSNELAPGAISERTANELLKNLSALSPRGDTSSGRKKAARLTGADVKTEKTRQTSRSEAAKKPSAPAKRQEEARGTRNQRLNTEIDKKPGKLEVSSVKAQVQYAPGSIDSDLASQLLKGLANLEKPRTQSAASPRKTRAPKNPRAEAARRAPPSLSLKHNEADSLLKKPNSIDRKEKTHTQKSRVSDEDLSSLIAELKALEFGDAATVRPEPVDPLDTPASIANYYRKTLSEMRGAPLREVSVIRFQAEDTEPVRVKPDAPLPRHDMLIALLDPEDAASMEQAGGHKLDGIFLGAAIDAKIGDLCFFPTYSKTGAPARFVQFLFNEKGPVTQKMLEDSYDRKISSNPDSKAAKPKKGTLPKS